MNQTQWNTKVKRIYQPITDMIRWDELTRTQ